MVARNMSSYQKSSCCFKEVPIFSFRNTILLRSLRTSGLMDHAMHLEVGLKIMVDIFTSIVRTKDLNLSRELSFNLLVK
ncbi:hypothetical protein ACE6H2_016490 [Prunus campanulata]